jgi:enamine deaminase RidA (YjgF/YER057c/UK114 family)
VGGAVSRHHLLNPGDLPPPVGFSHGALAGEGRVLHIAGQTGHRQDLGIDPGLIEQFAQACRSVARVIEEAGGAPSDLVSMTIYTTDVEAYRAALGPIGEAYRAVFGHHFPAMALFGVERLFDDQALVELVCIAVVPG